MKTVIRSEVFESNSSATHELIIDSSGLEPSKLRKYKDGYIRVRPAYFGKTGMLTTQYEKLQYVITEALILAGDYTYPYESVYDSYVFRDLKEAICDYTGQQGIKILKPNGEYGFDHQVWPEDGCRFCREWDSESVIDFIFNKYVMVKMGTD